MAQVAVSLADGGGKSTVKTDDTWGWVKALKSGTSALATNANEIGSSIKDVGSVINSLFGGNDSDKKAEAGKDGSLLPLLAIGGGLALLLK